MTITRLFVTATAFASLVAVSGCSSSKPAAESAHSAATPSVAGKAPAQPGPGVHRFFVGKPPLGTKAWCPVTNEEFAVTEKTEVAEYQGRTYAFCCPDCKPSFEKNPPKYAVVQ